MWNDILANYTLRIVLLGTALLGGVSGAIGVFLTLRKQGLVGDALSHATLPGIVLAYMITGESSLYMSILGAIVASVVSMFIIEIIKRYSIVKNDAALAIILSSMFGLGQVFLSIIRDTAGQDQARLKSFIFGQAATMSSGDVGFLVIILSVVFLTFVVFWRHIKLFIFNRDFYHSLGFSSTIINVILNALTILVVVSGIQSVGVILMSALLIAPGVAARLWSNKLNINIVIATVLGALAGVFGTYFGVNMSTGPVIVIFATSFVIISMILAPKKGLLWVKINEQIHKQQIKKYHVLIHIFENNETDGVDFTLLESFYKLGYLKKTSTNYDLSDKGIQKVSSIMVGEIR